MISFVPTTDESVEAARSAPTSAPTKNDKGCREKGSVLNVIKRQALSTLRAAGVFSVVSNSHWRRQRLLILCYHGISQDDEHEWNPGLYMSVERFSQRMRTLQEHRCHVLSLDDALKRLRTGSLPERSVCLTFDDGFFNFYSRALPVLERYNYPATVYLTTYYAGCRLPIFSLACSYVLWKASSSCEREDPRKTRLRAARVEEVRRDAAAKRLSIAQRDDVVAGIASMAGVDYGQIRNRRILQLMNGGEIARLAKSSIAIGLHSHRHRTPMDETLFKREILDNRACIRELSHAESRHFCYPNGHHRPEFIRWLEELGVESATTCKPDFATQSDHPLMLPRLVDTSTLSEIEFESWIAGVGALLPNRFSMADLG
jgi:peptidoglycan/xylan/chitin deacetylase (PgdA/CDA1 family)